MRHELATSTEEHLPEKKSYIFLLFTSIFFLDILLFFLDLPVAVVVIIHMILVAVSIGIVKWFAHLGWDQRFSFLFAVLFTTMGAFGAAVCLLTLAIYSVYKHFISPMAELWEMLYPKIRLEKQDIVYERLIYGIEDASKEGAKVAFQDVMICGTEQQKRTVIEKILKHFHPQFFSTLFLALNDPANSIRVYAANAIASLDARFFEDYLLLKKQFKEHPHNPEVLLALAQQCAAYINSQILDVDREKKIRKEAIETYKMYLQLVPDDIQARLTLAKLYLSSQQPLHAKTTLEKVIQSGNRDPAVYLAWMNILFELQDYVALRQFSTEFVPDKKINLTEDLKLTTLKEFVSLWGVSENLAYKNDKTTG